MLTSLRSLALGAVLTIAPGIAEEGVLADAVAADAGARGGAGLALRTAKALVAADEGPQVIDHALILVKDGKIEAIGPAREVEVPEGYVLVDVGEHWVMPGMLDLHSHVGGGMRDINDMVYQANPGLRIRSTVVPDNDMLQKPVAAGVTSLLYIPGSGTNMGGVGLLMKTGVPGYEDCILRDPGSLKIAQGDNPTRWGYGMGRVLMNHHLRKTIEKGLAYATSYESYEQGVGPKPERNIQLDVFRDLKARDIQVSTHTQYYQLVMMSILMLSRDYGFDTFIDHGSFDSYKTTPLALEHDVAAILGPREIMAARPPRYDTDGQIHGSAWGFQDRGHPQVGFNTDAPVVPQEELPLQAAMGVRYGFNEDLMQSVRGVTIVPAKTMNIHHRVGSLEVGKDADLVVVTGNPIDPRNGVELVWVNGTLVYDATEGRRW
ncbi:MAG: amidohydrolase family protein [Planctomycetota bacterium]|nr:amidohydrolase family protein [Planctomycetota bacterium]